MGQQLQKQANAKPTQIEHKVAADSRACHRERKRIYVELCGSPEDIGGFLSLCADHQVKMIVHLRPPLRQDQ